MHEVSLISDLLRSIDTVAREANAERVTQVTVTFGALCHISVDHFRDHFSHWTRGTVADGAELEIVRHQDTSDPHAQDIRLESVTVSE